MPALLRQGLPRLNSSSASCRLKRADTRDRCSGCIGKPARVAIGKHLKAGLNRFGIEPFAPETVRLVISPMRSQ